MLKHENVNVFFSCDDNYLPFCAVAINSLIKNAGRNNTYNIIILHDGIKEERMKHVTDMSRENVRIEFFNVSEKIKPYAEMLALRDYYTISIYYRIFIPTLFPKLKKAVYLDSDIVVLSDIAGLYSKKLGNNLVGAIFDEVVAGRQEYRDYSMFALGIHYNEYFNSGIMVMNLDAMRKAEIEKRFIDLLSTYHFRTICPDQDYLNIMCHGRVRLLSQSWNKMAMNECLFGTPNLVHYNMFCKPWKYENVPYEKYFHKYAAGTPFYADIKKISESYSDADRARDKAAEEKLAKTAVDIISDEITFAKVTGFKVDEPDNTAEKENLDIYRRISDYEKMGGEYFFKDVENDPPSHTLMPDEVDYLCRKPKTKILRTAANILESAAASVIDKRYNIKIEGAENLIDLPGGAVITSNHFSPTENIAVRKAIKSTYRKKSLYKIVREGNYFMPGMIGFLLKYCNTLPLSGNIYTMANLNHAVAELLSKGNLILIYPEQAMWRNYRKPRPYRIGAYYYAAKSNVPVIPCFVTVDNNKKPYGKFVAADYEYTVHVMPPIFPDSAKSVRENAAEMQNRNFEMCKSKYEEVYKIPLSYEDIG